MVSAGQSIDRMAFTGESAEVRKRKLLKLGASPYFGRINFGMKGKMQQKYNFADTRKLKMIKNVVFILPFIPTSQNIPISFYYGFRYM